MELSSFFCVKMYTLHVPEYPPAGYCYRYRTWSLVLRNDHRFRVFETRVLGAQQIQLTTEDGENGDLGAVAP